MQRSRNTTKQAGDREYAEKIAEEVAGIAGNKWIGVEFGR